MIAAIMLLSPDSFLVLWWLENVNRRDEMFEFYERSYNVLVS